MKKKLIPFLTVLFFVSGCYIYKPYSELSEAETNSNTDKAVALTRPIPGENPNADGNKTSTPSSRQMNNNQVPDLDQKEAEMKKMAEENMSEDDIKRMKEEQIKKQEMDNQTERQKGSFMTSDGRTADDMRGKKAAPKPKQDIDFEPGTLKSKIQPNKNRQRGMVDGGGACRDCLRWRREAPFLRRRQKLRLRTATQCRN